MEAPVPSGGDRFKLALELAPRAQAAERKPSLLDGGQDRAAGLVRVCTVREAAVGGERLDVLEGALDVALPELELSQSRRVDDERTVRKRDEFTVRGRVPTGSIRGECRRAHQLRPGQPVQQRRFADAR